MIDEREHDWVAEEIEAVTERRDRMLLARAKSPHLQSPKTDQQLQILDRQLLELREVAA